MTLERRIILTQQGLDPLLHYFYTQAVKEYLRQSKKPNDVERELVPRNSTGKQQSQAVGMRRKTLKIPARPAPLAVVATLKSGKIRGEPAKGETSELWRSRMVSDDIEPEEPAVGRQIQELDNMEQEKARASRKRRRIMNSQANLAESGSRTEDFEGNGREIPAAREY
jgi:hypothetical protein